MNKKLDLSAMFPDPEVALKVQRANAPMFMRCPKGCALPNRGVQGRCTPTDHIVDPDEYGMQSSKAPGARRTETTPHAYEAEMDLLPKGLESLAYTKDAADPAEAELFKAQAHEALALMRAVGIRNARHALLEHPDVGSAPDIRTMTSEEWVKKRISQLVPYALAIKEFNLFYGSQAQKDETADEILDRSGAAPRKAEAAENYRGPVVILNLGTTGTPYDAQLKKGSSDGNTVDALPTGDKP
jgi:hypothetical protein